DIYYSWPTEDPRRTGSILNVDDPAEGLLAYHDGCQAQVHDTHLWNKKYTAISVPSDDPAEETYLGTGITSLYWKLYPNFMSLDYQNNSFQDFCMLRFADVLLMGAELGSANGQSYFDRVRSRVGLKTLPLTLENIKNERRWELAFEGIRYYDLLRWHDENLITEHRSNLKVKNLATDATVSVPFRVETKGFLPIPDQEIQKAQGTLVQNPGWASNQGNY
ncbi:MAG: RagB/SusD family nutrient uptake outer membrane protein, partial [Muribaculaceae bacterium]|nr:RagB/SusD family nutrient uptake outer membrane protein [Muribaculaceae bacterium]